jgi:hypothetical protein
LDADRLDFLKGVFGDDIKIVTEDLQYGDNPVSAVQALIQRLKDSGDEVVAIEAIAPFPVLIKLVDGRRDLGVTLIRVQFARDEGGRAIVTGKDTQDRDNLKFSHYEELLRIEFDTKPLIAR